MSSASKYTCSVCGKEHTDWPAITWSSPYQYNVLTDKDKECLCKIDSDFCVISHPDQTDRFIRCTLHQQVLDHDEEIDYGVWVSLSEKNFNDYVEHYNDREYEGQYFGWLCNNVPPYEKTLSIPTTVRTRANGQRPFVVPHQDHDHPFVHDFYNGISLEDAISRIHESIEVDSINRQSDQDQ